MKIGDRVTYRGFAKNERGIVKSFSTNGYVFVVYHCDDNWDRYFEYTAARTAIDDLDDGWDDLADSKQ